MCLFSTIIFVSLFSGKNALVNVRKIGWIWYFGCNRGWWLLEQKSSTWFRNRTKGPCVYVAQWQAQARVQLSSLQAGPCCMLLARPRHYLTYYVLSSSHCALTSLAPCAQRDCVQTFWKIPSYGAAGRPTRPAPQFGEDFFILRLRQNLQEWHLSSARQHESKFECFDDDMLVSLWTFQSVFWQKLRSHMIVSCYCKLQLCLQTLCFKHSWCL